MQTTQGDDARESCGKVRCRILLSPEPVNENTNESAIRSRGSGFLQISPSREGPWTTVRLNYAAPAACWRLGNDVVASELSIMEGSRYVNIRSLVSVCNCTEFMLELCLVSQESRGDAKALDDVNDIEGSQTNLKNEICMESLGPGDTMPLPLSALTQTGLYVLRLKPSNLPDSVEYSWSSVVDRIDQSGDSINSYAPSGISVSNLTESEELISCTEISGTSSSGSQKFWFSVSIQATEISKDIHSDPIQDWKLVIKSPLSITNSLPLMAEFSVLEMQKNGSLVSCSRGVLNSGETVNVHNADMRNPLFFSLLPNRGWLPVHVRFQSQHNMPISCVNKYISV